MPEWRGFPELVPGLHQHQKSRGHTQEATNAGDKSSHDKISGHNVWPKSSRAATNSGPVGGSEGRSRQAIPVEEIAARAVGPRVADRHGLRNVRAGDHY